MCDVNETLGLDLVFAVVRNAVVTGVFCCPALAEMQQTEGDTVVEGSVVVGAVGPLTFTAMPKTLAGHVASLVGLGSDDGAELGLGQTLTLVPVA